MLFFVFVFECSNDFKGLTIHFLDYLAEVVVDLGHGIFVTVVLVHNRLFRLFVANIYQLDAFDFDQRAGAILFVTYPELYGILVVDNRINALLAVPRRFGHVTVFLVDFACVVVSV